MSTDKTNAPPHATGDSARRPDPSLVGEGKTGGEYVPKLQQNAEKLRNVAQQVESFLMRQIDRLQIELEQAETLGDRDELGRLTEEFEVMRQRWDAERQRERNQLQDDSQRLVEAWQRLETEQRELLKYRVPNNKLTGLGNGRVAPHSTSPLSPTHPVATAAPTLVCSGGGVATATPSTHRNQLQFQQLRREMMEHARQRGKR